MMDVWIGIHTGALTEVGVRIDGVEWKMHVMKTMNTRDCCTGISCETIHEYPDVKMQILKISACL